MQSGSARLQHTKDSIEIAHRLNSRDISMWFADGSNYPGTANIRQRKRWFTEDAEGIACELVSGQRMLIEYKPFEPAFYHTDIADWGMALLLSRAAGPQAKVLVDTGHHYAAQNIEQIVAWLLSEDMLGGFHFNDRRYADDDLTMGSIDPYQVFRIFHEIRFFEWETGKRADIAYMVDQSHNLKGKIEAMIQTVTMAQELFAKAALVDHEELCSRAEELRSGRGRVSAAGCIRHRRPARDSGLARLQRTAQKSDGGIPPERLPRAHHQRTRGPELTERFFLCLRAFTAKPYLAFDFGAESGRAVLAHLQSGILTTEEVHRFPQRTGRIRRLAALGCAPALVRSAQSSVALERMELAGIGVDAWGVDYALLGERGELAPESLPLSRPSHRWRHGRSVQESSARKKSTTRPAFSSCPSTPCTSSSPLSVDTPKLLAAAKYLLTIPDLFNYWLTGNAVCEFTNATTTQMVDPVKRTWATDLMQRLDLPSDLAGTDRRAGLDPWDAPARHRTSFLSCRHARDRSRVPRYRLGGSCHLRSRWHCLS